MASEGRRERDAAKKRLAAARAQRSSASEMIDAADALAERAKEMARTAGEMARAAKEMASSAKSTREQARSLLRSSQAEVEEAEAFLREAEERCHVIEIVDSDCENEGENASRKRRKESGAQVDLAAGAAAVVTPPTSVARVSSAGDIADVEEILIEEAGVPEVNGIYKRCQSDGRRRAVLSFAYDKNFPVYSKGGSWDGAAGDFFICRAQRSRWPNWYILHQEEQEQDYATIVYIKKDDCNLPPKTGWNAHRRRSAPGPQITWM